MWGGWSAILEDPTDRQLLRDRSVVKPSHHGSANGTPPAVVESRIFDGAIVLLSVDLRQWRHIPNQSVLSAVEARADRIRRTGAVSDPPYVDVELPNVPSP